MSGPEVLHLCHTTNRRGAEIFGRDLAAELTRQGVPSTVRAIQPGTMANPLPIETMGTRGRTPLAMARLRLLAARHDAVVGHGASTLLAGTAATVGTRTPFVYRLIGDPRFWGDVRGRSLRTSGPLRSAAAVVALWQAAGRAVEELHGVPAERVRVIPNGRDEAEFAPPTAEARRAARRALGIDDDRPVLGFIGSLSWEKEPIRAIEAAALVPDATLVVAGDGPMRAEVEAAAAASSGNVVVLGSVAGTVAVHHALDALVLTSRTEGMPGVVIEAGLCGVPAVAADVGGTADLVDSTTGHLVPAGSAAGAYAEAVRDVLTDGPRRGEALGERARAGYTLASSAQRWAALLRELTATAG